MVGVIPAGLEAMEKSLRRTHGEVAGEKLDTAPVNRCIVNAGTGQKLPSLEGRCIVHCRLLVGAEPS